MFTSTTLTSNVKRLNDEQIKSTVASRGHRLFLCLSIVLTFTSAGCKRTEAQSAEPQKEGYEKTAAEVLPADLSLDPDGTHYLFTFVQNGRSQTVSSVAQVPEAFRSRVSITDLSLSTAERQAHRVNYFADLTQKDSNGRYRTIAVSRFDAAKGEGIKIALPEVPKGAVVLYSAEWCGFCKKTKAYFEREGVAFVERDVDKMSGASEELAEKLKANKMKASGIPVSDWQGTLVVGYNTKRFDALRQNPQFQQKNTKSP